MKNKTEFIIDKTTYTLKVKRTFDAPLMIVWKAWTDAAFLDLWWAPERYKSTTKHMEFKEGGHRHYRMQGPDNFEMWGITSYNSIQLHSNFSGHEYSADKDGKSSSELPMSDYIIHFIDEDTCTLIDHHTSFNSLEDMEQSLEYGFEEGMLGAFDRLDGCLSQAK